MDESLLIILAVVLAYITDVMIGDPHGWPHPIILMGKSISFGVKKFNRGNHRLLKGGIMSVTLILFTVSLILGFEYLASFNKYIYSAFIYLFVFWGIANKCLIYECQKVFQVLREEGVEAGRERLSYIVGRNTKDLTPQQIRKATLETMSENLSDGVIAPLMYFILGGVPAMMAYKMINTLDSMIGYKNEKYIYFGRVAAYIDDVANFLPSRITALLMAIVTMSRRSCKFIGKYGRCHSSPNAGYPEAALAGILNCKFGGPSKYGDVIVDKLYIGDVDHEFKDEDIKKATYVNHAVTLLYVLVVCYSCYVMN